MSLFFGPKREERGVTSAQLLAGFEPGTRTKSGEKVTTNTALRVTVSTATNGYARISGWTQILQLMPKGSNWKVYIPAELGYGERGAGGAIPPNSTLIFEIDLLDEIGRAHV